MVAGEKGWERRGLRYDESECDFCIGRMSVQCEKRREMMEEEVVRVVGNNSRKLTQFHMIHVP